MVKEIMREQYSARLGLNRDHSLLVVTIYTYDRDEPTGNGHIGPRPLERSHQIIKPSSMEKTLNGENLK